MSWKRLRFFYQKKRSYLHEMIRRESIEALSPPVKSKKQFLHCFLMLLTCRYKATETISQNRTLTVIRRNNQLIKRKIKIALCNYCNFTSESKQRTNFQQPVTNFNILAKQTKSKQPINIQLFYEKTRS